MKVHELKEILNNYDDTADVFFFHGGVTHYAKFPNELAERCILCGTAEGDVVLDPFIGSGTSCRVANRYGRQYIGD